MRAFLLGIFLITLPARGSEDFFDRLGEALTASAMQDTLRAKLSGTLDLEHYDFQRPAPALLQTTDGRLFNPRLAVFLDAEWGTKAYLFAQVRVDRGFDPTQRDWQARLDEYALRISPWKDGRLNLQVGKFATVVGNWTLRHGSWANPFVSAPLPYEYLTGVWDADAIRNSNVLLQWSHLRPGLPAAVTAREKQLRIPILWGPSYAVGAAVSGVLGRFDYAWEVKHAPLSSRPETWDRVHGHWSHPTVSGRVGYRPNQMWTLGVSASAGSYLRPFAQRGLLAGRGLGDYRQLVLAADAGFAWHHWQVWSEVYASRFQIPGVGHADTLAGYIETKYKFTPQLFGAVRLNQQLFGAIPDRGTRTRWGRNAERIDLAVGYRFTPHSQLKLEYDLQHGDADPRDYSHLLALQLTVRF